MARKNAQMTEQNAKKFVSDDRFSTVPGPVNVNAKSPEEDREIDKKNKEKTHLKGKATASGNKVPGQTKAEMMTNAFDALKSLSKEELEERFQSIMNAINEEDDDIEYDDGDEENGGKKKKREFDANKFSARKMTKEDIGEFDTDIEAIFSGDEDLSEEFKEKAKSLFETVLVAKINEGLAQYVDEANEELNEAYNEFVSELTDNVDDYLSYVVEEWAKENEVAITSTIRDEIAESFISGLKNLFEDHFVEIPESKVDVVEELTQEIDNLESESSEIMRENIELKDELDSYRKAGIIGEVGDDLVETDFDKFCSLAENIEFRNDDDYREKLNMIKENYFSTDNSYTELDSINEELDLDLVDPDENGPQLSGPMKAYVDVLQRTVRKA